MNIALWIVQFLLAAAFFMAGTMKLTTPVAELAQAGMGGWVTDSPELLIRFIGLSEVAGALGLVLPGLTKIQTWLAPTAAAALGLVMVLAAGTHISYGELGAVVPNAVLFSLVAFVAWGRFVKAPHPSRTSATQPREATA